MKAATNQVESGAKKIPAPGRAVVRRRVLPLLVPPGAGEDLQRRTIEDEAALPA